MQTKTCKGCQEEKPIAEFYKDKTTKDGYRGKCKICINQDSSAYYQTEAGKKAQRKFRQGEKRKIALKRYNQSEKGKQTKAKSTQSEKYKQYKKSYKQSKKGKNSELKYWQSEKGKQTRRRAYINWRKNHPDKIRANRAVNIAIKQGAIPPIRTQICIDCGNQARHYHHHMGYDETNILNVIPVCGECHRIRHATAVA